jgi:hypothetical protein
MRGIAVSGLDAASEATTSPLLRAAEEDAPRVAAGPQAHRPGASSPEASIAKLACALITFAPRTR